MTEAILDQTENIPKSTVPVADRSGPHQVIGFCVGDWDGDGWPDVILSRYDQEKQGNKDVTENSLWLYTRK